MSHRTASRATHHLTATGRKAVVYSGGSYGTTAYGALDELGEPVYEHVQVATDVPVRYTPAGTEYVREDGGERVRRNPTVRARATRLNQVEPGMTIELTPLGEPSTDLTTETFEAVTVEGRHGRRTRAALTIIELEAQ